MSIRIVFQIISGESHMERYITASTGPEVDLKYVSVCLASIKTVLAR